MGCPAPDALGLKPQFPVKIPGGLSVHPSVALKLLPDVTSVACVCVLTLPVGGMPKQNGHHDAWPQALKEAENRADRQNGPAVSLRGRCLMGLAIAFPVRRTGIFVNTTFQTNKVQVSCLLRVIAYALSMRRQPAWRCFPTR